MEWDPQFRWLLYGLIAIIGSLVAKEAFKERKKEAMKMTKKNILKNIVMAPMEVIEKQVMNGKI